MANDNKTYTVDTAADRLGVHPATIRRAIRSGDLAATRHGARAYVLQERDLIQWDTSRDASVVTDVYVVLDMHGRALRAYTNEYAAWDKMNELLPGWDAEDAPLGRDARYTYEVLSLENEATPEGAEL